MYPYNVCVFLAIHLLLFLFWIFAFCLILKQFSMPASQAKKRQMRYWSSGRIGKIYLLDRREKTPPPHTEPPPKQSEDVAFSDHYPHHHQHHQHLLHCPEHGLSEDFPRHPQALRAGALMLPEFDSNFELNVTTITIFCADHWCFHCGNSGVQLPGLPQILLWPAGSVPLSDGRYLYDRNVLFTPRLPHVAQHGRHYCQDDLCEYNHHCYIFCIL